MLQIIHVLYTVLIFRKESLVDKMTVTENTKLTEIVYDFMRPQGVFYLSLKFKYVT